jgi:hypothetical protein
MSSAGDVLYIFSSSIINLCPSKMVDIIFPKVYPINAEKDVRIRDTGRKK